jgi:hypothetical protein
MKIGTLGSGSGGRVLAPLYVLWRIPGLSQNQWTHAFKLLTK